MQPLTLALTFSLLVASLGSAQQRFVHLGARAASMGGAFTAVADDASAFYWNPAGYAFGPVFQGGFHWSDSEMDRSDNGSGPLIADRMAGFAFGLTFMGVGGTFARQTSSTIEGGDRSSQGLESFDLAVSLLHSLPLDNLVVGGSVHYLKGETHESLVPASAPSSPAAIVSGRGLESSKATFDLGALYEPNEWLRVGILFRRLVEPRFPTESGNEILLQRHARAGVAFRLPQRTLVSLDADLSRQGIGGDRWREISLGVERAFFDGAFALRAGFRAETGPSPGVRPAFSVGAGGRVRFVHAEAAYVGSTGGRDDGLWFSLTLAP